MIVAARESGSLTALQVGLVYRGFVHYWQGEYRASEARMAEALVVCEERGDGFEVFAVRMFLGLARANQGRMSEALADFEHAEVFAARNGDRFWQPRLVSQQGWVHRELAAVGKARELDARALALARENPSPWTPEVDALMNLAVDGVRAGDPDGASDLLATLEDGTRTRDWFRWMNELRLEVVATEHYAARGAFDATPARASRLEADRDARRRAQLPVHCGAPAGRGHARGPGRAPRGGGEAGARARGARPFPRPARDLEVAPRAGPAAAALRRRGRRAALLRTGRARRRHHRARRRRHGPARELPREPRVRQVLAEAGRA